MVPTLSHPLKKQEPLGGNLIIRGGDLAPTKLLRYLARVAESCSYTGEASHLIIGDIGEQTIANLLSVLGLARCLYSTSLSLLLSW